MEGMIEKIDVRKLTLLAAATHFASFVNCGKSFDGFQVAKVLREMAEGEKADND
jgi:hypothetical protein